MADIRINALATTAASTASDDFIAVDGSANGTRKLNAYSPTFGGNLTVSGTGTSTFGGILNVGGSFASPTSANTSLNLNTTTANWEIGRNATAGGFYIYGYGGAGYALKLADATGNATLAGNLTVSGTALDLTNSNNGQTGLTVTNSNGGTSTYTKLGTWNGTVGVNLVTWGSAYTGRANESWLYTNGLHPLKFGTDSTARMTLTSTGNFLVGTGTDSSNGIIQLATHTTSAGGIGFGTDTSLFRTSAGVLGVSGAVNAAIELYGSAAGVKAITMFEAGTIAAQVSCVSGSFQLKTGSSPTTALTLDSSQNATFAKTVTASSTGSAAAKMGTGFAGFAEFSNATGFGAAGTYALIQDNTGETYLNTASGKSLFLRVANANALTITSTTATFAGSIAINNTVQTAASVASTHKVTISIGGSTYYLLATNV